MIIPADIVFPVQMHIGSAMLPLHAITEIGGMFIAFRYFLFLQKKHGDVMESSNRVWILIAATLGALIGSRLIGALEHPDTWMASRNMLMYAYRQKTIVGGLLGGLFGVEIAKVIMIEKKSTGDLFVFPLLLAMIVGRIGCFSMGVFEETYGIATDLPWAMDLGDHVPRHPVALYEIGYLLILWLAFKYMSSSYALQNGALFKMFMIFYLGFRFILDFIKPHYTYEIGLSTIQITCLLGLLWYARYLFRPNSFFANTSTFSERI